MSGLAATRHSRDLMSIAPENTSRSHSEAELERRLRFLAERHCEDREAYTQAKAEFIRVSLFGR